MTTGHPSGPPSAEGTLVLGAGLIGGLTARLLVAQGERVVLADLCRPKAGGFGGAGSVDTAALDVRDFDGLCDLVRRHGVTRIVHTAALLSTAIRRDPLAGVAVNVLGTANVLECARRMELGRIVLASSTTVAYNTFAAHGPQPLLEDDPIRPISERPASLYAVTKLTGEHLALAYHALYGVDVVNLRYAAVLGGDLDAPTSVPGKLMQRLVQGAREGRDVVLDDPLLTWGGREEFVDARDCARANVHALRARDPSQRVYHVATGQWCTLAEFVAAMQRLHPQLRVALGVEPTTGFAGFAHRRPAPSSIVAAQRDLGFECAFDLRQSLEFWTAPRASATLDNG
jgi:UDP-glucose 4-epimerase